MIEKVIKGFGRCWVVLEENNKEYEQKQEFLLTKKS